jgi:hypothetical protein
MKRDRRRSHSTRRGHAVIALALGIGVTYVDINAPCEKHLCGVGGEWLDEMMSSGRRKPLAQDWDQVRKETVAVLAGSIAEEYAGAESDLEMAAFDGSYAAALSQLMCYTSEEFEPIFSWLRLHARGAVLSCREMISAVAGELCTRGKLDREELWAVVGTVFSGRQQAD